jgi:hypothetical protein
MVVEKSFFKKTVKIKTALVFQAQFFY